ncbi:Uncharacterised protein [Vibrio cholerae]|nr:Uncharacterised protein [Vibrio cholerae]
MSKKVPTSIVVPMRIVPETSDAKWLTEQCFF